jgi:hypothetical protein
MISKDRYRSSAVTSAIQNNSGPPQGLADPLCGRLEVRKPATRLVGNAHIASGESPMLDTKRHEFIALLSAGGLLLAVKVRRARAQQPTMPLVGVMSPLSIATAARNIAALRNRLRELGYTEGHNINIEYRFGDGLADRFPVLVERGDAVVIARDSFSIDDAGARAQAGQRLDDQREAMGEVIARTAIEPHARAVLPGNNPKAIMLDLVQPLAARGQLIGFGRKARRDEPGREGTLGHAEQLALANHNCNFADSKRAFWLGSVHDAPPIRVRRSQVPGPSMDSPCGRAGGASRRDPHLRDLCAAPARPGLSLCIGRAHRCPPLRSREHVETG